MKEKESQKLSSTAAVGGKKVKKVKFTTPPKARHSLSGMKRTALKPLQAHSSNPKLLVGAGSPRVAAIGKNTKRSDLAMQAELKFSPLPTLSAAANKSAATNETTQSAATNETTQSAATKETSLVDKGTQTEVESSIDYQMCTAEVPPVQYWQALAEKRRDALAETLKENEELYSEVERLKSRVSELESQVHNMDYFAMMYTLAKDEGSESQH